MAGEPAKEHEITVLIVDDDETFHHFVAQFLDGFQLVHAHNSWECVETITRQRIDVVLLDLNLPDAAGFRVLEDMRAEGDDIAVIVLSSYVDRDSIQRARACGARDVLDKTYRNCSRLPELIRQALSEPRNKGPRWNPYREHHRAFLRLEQSTSLNVQRLVRDAHQAALLPGPVLITGEAGCDLEIVGRYIHACTDEPAMPFAITTAVPGPDFTTTLFGDASYDYSLLAAADGGCLFIDQVHRLDDAAQAYLLQLLTLGSVGCGRPRGDELHVQVRILAATTADLEQLVRERFFNSALYKMLKKVSLRIPPLRERRMDLLPELDALMEETAAAMGVTPPEYDTELAEALVRYPFPGNERELRAMVTSACARFPGLRITAADFLPSSPASS